MFVLLQIMALPVLSIDLPCSQWEREHRVELLLDVVKCGARTNDIEQLDGRSALIELLILCEHYPLPEELCLEAADVDYDVLLKTSPGSCIEK